MAMIASSLGARPEISVGVAQLLFEVCRGVEHQFHSCTLTFMPLLLDTMGQCTISEDSSPDCHSPVPASSGSHDHVLGPTPSESHDQVVFQCLCKMVELMVDHTRREHAEPLWTPLLVSSMGAWPTKAGNQQAGVCAFDDTLPYSIQLCCPKFLEGPQQLHFAAWS